MSLDRLRKFYANWSEKPGVPNTKLGFGWFAGVANSFNVLLMEGKITSEELQSQVTGFIDQVSAEGFVEAEDAMKEKIHQADALIARLFSHFDSKE